MHAGQEEEEKAWESVLATSWESVDQALARNLRVFGAHCAAAAS